MSLIDKLKTSNICKIYVIGFDLSRVQLYQLNQLSRNDISIEYVKVDIEECNIPKTEYLKLSIFNIFNKLDKLLYLDSDILIMKDISELYDIDIDDYYCACIKDILKAKTIYNKFNLEKFSFLLKTNWDYNCKNRLNIDIDNYFNTGILLLNLKKIRNDDIDLLDYKLNNNLVYLSNDIYNLKLNKIKYIDFKYNTQIYTLCNYDCNIIKDRYGLDTYDKKEIMNNASILHFNYKHKPWIFYDIYGSKYWNEYYNKSIFSNNKLMQKSILNDFNKIKLYQYGINNRYKPLIESYLYPVHRNMRRYVDYWKFYDTDWDLI